MLLRRTGLAVLVLSQGSLALWALLAPRAFYDDFPGGGRSWVASLGPYDEHLVRDVGALSLGLTVVLLAALLWPDGRLRLVAALAYLAWSVPHLAFHLTADDALATGDRIASEAGEVLATLIALALAVEAVRERPKVRA
jgi:K+-transporting ATPase KdpF subunit